MADQSLWYLCQEGRLDEVRTAIANGVDGDWINEWGDDGLTGLMWMLENEYHASLCVKLVLRLSDFFQKRKLMFHSMNIGLFSQFRSKICIENIS